MQEQPEAPAAKTTSDLKQSRELANIPDQKIDMFSARGFALAQRIAQAFSTADAVPACFRAQVMKKDRSGEIWVDNPSAFGNCLVAIETAQTVGMSITAVMQNSNIIEGKLSWSGQFKIGAVNASGRFTPLRFDMKNKGVIKAKYKEKGAWNDAIRKFDMTEKTVELENLECIAWALPANVPFPPGVYTLDQARAAGLPVIEGPPVSMKLAVEEGWYAKSGSKWQTEMKHKMLPIRAGAYFSDLHASDIVMGMGRTSDEVEDMSIIDVQQQPDGSYASKTVDDLRAGPRDDKHPHAETVETTEVSDKQPEDNTPPPGHEPAVDEKPAADEKPAEKEPIEAPPEVKQAYESVAAGIFKALNLDTLAEAADLIQTVGSAALRAELSTQYKRRMEELTNTTAEPAKEEKKAAPARRVRRNSPGAE